MEMSRKLIVFASTSGRQIGKYSSRKYTSSTTLPSDKAAIAKVQPVAVEEKVKLVDKWKAYWRDLFRDYKEVFKDIWTDFKSKPVKGVTIISLFGSAVYFAKNNPDMNHYRSTVLNYANDFIFVGPSIRNPRAKEHLKLIEQSYNNGTLRIFSFGLFSIIWNDNYSNTLGLYKSSCSYLQPDWLTFHKRIIDIGFLNKWYIIEQKMLDCDVNPEEWGEPVSD